MKGEIFAATTRAKAKAGQMNTGHEDQTMTTTIKEDSHRTPLNSTTKEKDARKEKESLAIRRAKVKAKVVEKARTIKENETQLTTSHLSMSSSLHISDLLKVAKDTPILHTGINDTATEYSTYPVKGHNKLLSSSGKPASTPLNSMLAMRMIKIPSNGSERP
jgi:hypothetical protein